MRGQSASVYTSCLNKQGGNSRGVWVPFKTFPGARHTVMFWVKLLIWKTRQSLRKKKKTLICSSICYASLNLNSLFKNDSSLTPGSETWFWRFITGRLKTWGRKENTENMKTTLGAHRWICLFLRTEVLFKDAREQLSFNLEISFLQAPVALLLSCKFSSILLFRKRRETIYCLNG